MRHVSDREGNALIWDLPVRAFHWLLAGSFATAYLLAETERLRDIHVMLGYTVLGLVSFRIVWGFIGTRYARFRSFLYGPREAFAYVRGLVRGNAAHYPGHNPAGSLAIWAILGIAALTAVAGWATYNEVGGDAVEEFHEVLASAWLWLVGAHIAGVVLSSVLERQNLARAMLTGYKRAEPSAGIRHRAGGVGALVIATVLAFWAWSITGPKPGAAAGGEGEAASMASFAEYDD